MAQLGRAPKGEGRNLGHPGDFEKDKKKLPKSKPIPGGFFGGDKLERGAGEYNS